MADLLEKTIMLDKEIINSKTRIVDIKILNKETVVQEDYKKFIFDIDEDNEIFFTIPRDFFYKYSKLSLDLILNFILDRKIVVKQTMMFANSYSFDVIELIRQVIEEEGGGSNPAIRSDLLDEFDLSHFDKTDINEFLVKKETVEFELYNQSLKQQEIEQQKIKDKEKELEKIFEKLNANNDVSK